MSTTPSTRQNNRLADTQVPASLCLTALSVATAITLCRVFPDWEYLRPMLVVVVGTHTVAALLRYAGAHVLLALPVLGLTIVELLGAVYYRDTLTGFIPTSRTFELMRLDLRLVIEQFPTAVAPVPSVGSYAVIAATALAVCALMSDTFAFRAMGRIEAVVPTGVVFVFTAALGTDRHRVVVAALWIGMALLAIAVLRFRQTTEEAAWMGARRLGLAAAFPAIALSVGLTAVVAAAVAPRLPGAGEKALVDTRNRQGSVTEVLSPLVDIGAELRNRGNLELFTVASSDGSHYWRVISLPDFNGSEWQPPEEDLVEMGNRSGDVLLPGETTQQLIKILAMGGHLVPAAYYPTSVSPDDVYWADESHSLVLPDTNLQRGDQIDITSRVPRPTVELLRNTTVTGAPDSEYYNFPSSVPDSARNAAVTVTQGALTPFDKAIALQNWFRTEFTYNANVQLSNSNDAIDAFLRTKQGFCQQFAGTFAVMARLLGLPSRVAVGFTGGDLGADGLYHVFGRHAHAWPELWFDGVGWVAFEPTPGRGNPDGTSYNGVNPQQDETGSAAPGETQTTVGTIPIAPGDEGTPSTTVPAGGVPEATTTTVQGGVAGGGGSSDSGSSVPWPFVIPLLLLGAWVLVAPRVVRALAHRRDGSDAERVVSAWHRCLGALSLAGAPAVGGATPLEYARVAERATGVDHRALQELAGHVTQAVYAADMIDDESVSRAEMISAEIDTICRDRIPLSTRLRALVDVRLMRQRFAG